MQESEAARTFNRRVALGLIGSAVGTAFFVGCGSGGDSGTDSTLIGDGSSGTSGSASCTSTDALTGGPYPGDGTNTDETGATIDVLADAGIIRSDITSDIAGTNVQTGIPMTLTLTLVDLNNACAAVSDYYIYIWHCNKDGIYSAYEASTNGGGANYEGTTFLRGAQQTDSNGQVTFQTVFPGRYTGRVNHIHMEIFSGSAFTTADKVLTTQFCFPDATDSTADTYYGNSNSASLTNAGDSVFAWDYSTMMFTISGDTSGYTAAATIGVSL